MANTVILSRNGSTVYPATIPDAIIDPNTGKPFNFNTEYTINNLSADETGNFTLTHTSLGAAAEQHTHAISDVTDLQITLDNKSNIDHTHAVVTGIQINESTLTGDIKIEGKGNISVSKVRNNVIISITPFVADIANEIVDSNTNEEPFQVFVGTEAEYEAFKANMVEGKRYLVFIRS